METFKEISIGGLTKEQLLQQLANAGVQFNKYAETLFDHDLFNPSQHIEKVRLVKLSLGDLSLNNPCSYKAIVNKALGLGFKLCPLYLGAFLRLQYLSQSVGPYLTIASPLLENEENYPAGFYIRNLENVLWLRGYRVTGDAEWPVENEFIFIK